MKITKCKLNLYAFIAAFIILISHSYANEPRYIDSTNSQPEQTDVDRAEQLVDKNGVPYLNISKVGIQYHPAWVAIYALAYAGIETYDPRLTNVENTDKFFACIDWLEKNLKRKSNTLWVWEYNFDSTYNDVSIKAPWSSAFAQATGIQAFIAAYQKTSNKKYLELANQAAQALYTPLSEGGFLFESGSDIWFEEIPFPINNPSHILNGHMRTLLALSELANTDPESSAASYLKKGTDTLAKWMPLYDSGYWIKYDLNPRKKDLLFQIANPYGFREKNLKISEIKIIDPVTKKESYLKVGNSNAFDGHNRIAGSDWGINEKFGEKNVRKVYLDKFNAADDLQNIYFYLSLPDAKVSNLRDEWYEMEIEYFDDSIRNLVVKQYSISPESSFVDLRDGYLFSNGDNKWKKWKIPLRPQDLGYWVGNVYAEKHAVYLEKLTNINVHLNEWAKIARGYYNRSVLMSKDYKPAEFQEKIVPEQTPMVMFSLDKDSGMLLQIPAVSDTVIEKGFPVTKITQNGAELATNVGQAVVNPQGVADQLLKGSNYFGSAKNSGIYYNSRNYPFGYRFDKNQIFRQPAFKWIINPNNQSIGFNNGEKFITWPAKFDNVYNDVVTKAPWASSYTQALFIKSLYSEGIKFNPSISMMLGSLALNAFDADVSIGGVSSINLNKDVFFEEVPNKTHVLNGHLLSVNELFNIGKIYGIKKAINSAEIGYKSLVNNLYLFDTGYWLRYDLNPKNEVLFQIEGLDNTGKSLLIDSIKLCNPISATCSEINVASDDSFNGINRLSGVGWLESENIDGVMTRGFRNNVATNNIESGKNHINNVYFNIGVPNKDIVDYFYLQQFKVYIRYKDVSEGIYSLNIQSINSDKDLTFVPLRGGVFKTIGDNQWKEVTINLRPQDLGWFKGKDYQLFETNQLKDIYKFKNSWFINQYIQKQSYNYKIQSHIGINKKLKEIFVSKKLSLEVINQSKTYPNHGFSDIIDNDDGQNYVAGIEGENESFVELRIKPKIDSGYVDFKWENDKNYPAYIEIFGKSSLKSDYELISSFKKLQSVPQRIHIKLKDLEYLYIKFQNFKGQDRLLMRQLNIYRD